MTNKHHNALLDGYRLEFCDRILFEGGEYRPVGFVSDGVLLQEVVEDAAGTTLIVEADYLAEHLSMGLATYEREFYKYAKSAK